MKQTETRISNKKINCKSEQTKFYFNVFEVDNTIYYYHQFHDFNLLKYIFQINYLLLILPLKKLVLDLLF